MYQQGEIFSGYFDEIIREDYIIDVLMFHHKFFLTAHNSGDIHFRKLTELKNQEETSIIKQNECDKVKEAQNLLNSIEKQEEGKPEEEQETQ